VFVKDKNFFLENYCSLGEGLHVNKALKAWVDINQNKIYLFNKNNVTSFKTSSIPSVILKINSNEIIFGSNEGIKSLALHNGKEILLNCAPKFLNDFYRSNDGIQVDDTILMSFMHKEEPEKKSGYIYLIKDDSWHLIEEEIFIPNTFIKIKNDFFLISDSFKREIWLYDFSNKKPSKKLWHNCTDGVPDGGCKVNNHIFITMWDHGKISIFDLKGDHLQDLKVPCIRPTNCKFDNENSNLWVTSAKTDFKNSNDLNEIYNGRTFYFKIKKIN
tara:strand:+ start:476 stop:1294 length:819 start_codon:yes stop_codon:yes gene_type:complete